MSGEISATNHCGKLVRDRTFGSFMVFSDIFRSHDLKGWDVGYVQSAIRRPADEPAQLVDLKGRRVLTEEELERMRRSIVDNASAVA